MAAAVPTSRRLPADLQRAREPRASCARSAEPRCDVLVIDDNSPDGTGELADGLAAEPPLVRGAAPAAQGRARARVRRRLPPRARGRTTSSCSRWTATSRTTRRRARLIAAVEDGADVALGSRNVAGGGTRLGARAAPRSRGAPRSTPASSSACRSRPTGGFKASAARVLEAIDLDAIEPNGYAFQIETTYRALRRVPRRRDPDLLRRPHGGQSKMPRDLRSRPSGRCRRYGLRSVAGKALDQELDEATFDEAIAGGPLPSSISGAWCRP